MKRNLFTLAHLMFVLILASCTSMQRNPNGAQTTQITGWNFDWDDNIVYMPTPILLYPKGITPEIIKAKKLKGVPVSTEDFTEVKNVVGPEAKWKSEEVPERFKKYTQYDAVADDSYYFFRDIGANHFKQDLVRAIKGDKPPGTKKGTKFNWKGPSFEAFQTAMSDQESADWTTVITARGHSNKAIYDGIQYLQSKKYIKLVPPQENLYGVTNPEVSAKYNSPGAKPTSPGTIKTIVMMDFLDKMDKVKIEDSMLDVLNQDGTGQEKLHLWGFSDDDYDNYKKAVDALSKAIIADQTRWKHIKITLYYTGRMKLPEIKPHQVVIKRDGSLRPYPQDENEAQEVQRILETRKNLSKN